MIKPCQFIIARLYKEVEDDSEEIRLQKLDTCSTIEDAAKKLYITIDDKEEMAVFRSNINSRETRIDDYMIYGDNILVMTNDSIFVTLIHSECDKSQKKELIKQSLSWLQLEEHYSFMFPSIREAIMNCTERSVIDKLKTEIQNNSEIDRKGKHVFLKFVREKEKYLDTVSETIAKSAQKRKNRE
jgi:hypothetical protein